MTQLVYVISERTVYTVSGQVILRDVSITQVGEAFINQWVTVTA